MPHEATVDHSSTAENTPVIFRQSIEENGVNDHPSPKRSRLDDGKDHVSRPRPSKPRKPTHQHDEDFDSDDSAGSSNTGESCEEETRCMKILNQK